MIRRYAYDGGPMGGGPGRIIVHTTETLGVPSYGGATNPKNVAPHLTILRGGGVQQHHPYNRAARSLRNLAGGVETNRAGLYCVQIELCAYAKNGDNLPDVQMVSLRKVVADIREETGIPAVYRLIDRGSFCYGMSSRCRMRPAEWLAFTGVEGHLGVTENSHWDPGDFDFGLLFPADAVSEADLLPLKLGDGGEGSPKIQDVKLLQTMLRRAAKRPAGDAAWLKIDGDYGPETKARIVEVLKTDGDEVGGVEWDRLSALAYAAHTHVTNPREVVDATG